LTTRSYRRRDAIVKLGAPADLVIGIDEPSVQKTNDLMQQCDRVLATGGGAMVNAAYSSGTPALGVGVGNAVITVDETADLDDAAEKVATACVSFWRPTALHDVVLLICAHQIRISKTLDLAASCSADNSVILLDPIYDTMLEKLKAKVRLSELRNWLFARLIRTNALPGWICAG